MVGIREIWLRLKCERDSAHSTGGWRHGKHEEEGRSLQEQRLASTDSEGTGPRYYSCKRLNLALADNLDKPESRFFLRDFIK